MTGYHESNVRAILRSVQTLSKDLSAYTDTIYVGSASVANSVYAGLDDVRDILAEVEAKLELIEQEARSCDRMIRKIREEYHID